MQATPVPRHRRGARRRPRDRGDRRAGVLHRARRAGPRREDDAAPRGARARSCRQETGPQRRGVGRHPHRRAGGPARGGGHAPLQPQPRDGAVVLPADRHHPLVGGAVRHLPARARARHGAVLRGAARHGRVGRRSASSCSSSCATSSPAEVPLNFLNPRPGTPLQIRRSSSRWRPSAGSRCSASPCRR